MAKGYRVYVALSPQSPTNNRIDALVVNVNRLLKTPEEKIDLFMQCMGDDCFESKEMVSIFLLSQLKIQEENEKPTKQENHESKTVKKLFEKKNGEEEKDSTLDSSTSTNGEKF